MRRLLAVDGGGVRGGLTACFLVELERQVGAPLSQIFDFVAGTSTGALITAAIAAGLPATKILQIYEEDCPKLFSLPAPVAWLKRCAAGYSYRSEHIRDVLLNRLGAAAQWRMNDSPIRLLLTAKHVSGHPWYFVQDRPRNSQTTGAAPLVDCAVASAAAPTYFAPWYVPPGKDVIGWCYDGGVGVTGNPVHQACIEAFDFDDFDPADTIILSLGTGYFPTQQVNPPQGLLETLTWTIDTLVDSPIDEQTQLVQMYYPGISTRLNWQLPAAIDMADAAQIPKLVALGKSLAPSVDWRGILKI